MRVGGVQEKIEKMGRGGREEGERGGCNSRVLERRGGVRSTKKR